jgi:hypothetical protein
LILPYDDSKPSFCIDFDGVIHSYTSGWRGIDTVADPPVAGAREGMTRMAERYNLIIYSTRCMDPRGIEPVVRWLAEHEIPYTRIATSKPKAIGYLDDRAVRFEGSWHAITALPSDYFRPWNKKDRD